MRRMQHAKQLADDIREWVKALGFERHKLVIQVKRALIMHQVW